MTGKQVGPIFGAVVRAVAAPLLILALLHGLDGRGRADRGADADSKAIDVGYDRFRRCPGGWMFYGEGATMRTAHYGARRW